MAAAPNYPTYKWWETDDKTKRLYTELLAEKLSSPRKTPGSRTVSNGKDTGARQTSSPKRSPESDTHTSDVTDMHVHVEGALVKNNKEKQDEDNKFGKYTFETITIDTLAKYDYIKSPKKRAAPTVPISFFEQSNKSNNNSKPGTGDNKDKNAEKLVDRTSKGQFFFKSQKLSSAEKETKSHDEENQTSIVRDGSRRDKPSRAMKLEEIPEYTSSSSENSADETVVRVKTTTYRKEENKAQSPEKDSKEVSKNKQPNKNNQPLKIEELSSKFQLLSEEVAQLEFKMFEFSDDIQKLKQSMGFKSGDVEDKTADRSSGTEEKNEFRVTRQKSFTFADRFNHKAMLMKKQASPSKMLATKPGKPFPGKSTPEGTSKEEAMAELKKNEALNEIVCKIKEQELSEDDIQEILRCAKDKYIHKPNYLEEIGYGREND
ncbi:micronuclear linker histone polyprotein-like [Montipora foliosa]|uniref:micronuclear linker histone polyprotein-like n=1 Tax=Montipora foliosa TaxID=591990 RepID=UPI0035F217EA